MSEWVGLPYLVALIAITLSLFFSFRRVPPTPSNGVLLDYSIRSQEGVVKALANRVHDLEIRLEERELDMQRERERYEAYVDAMEQWGTDVERVARHCVGAGETLPIRPLRGHYWRTS